MPQVHLFTCLTIAILRWTYGHFSLHSFIHLNDICLCPRIYFFGNSYSGTDPNYCHNKKRNPFMLKVLIYYFVLTLLIIVPNCPIPILNIDHPSPFGDVMIILLIIELLLDKPVKSSIKICQSQPNPKLSVVAIV